MKKRFSLRLASSFQDKKAKKFLEKRCSLQGVILQKAQSVRLLSDTRWEAADEDPWFSFKLLVPAQWVFIKCETAPQMIYYASVQNSHFSNGRRIQLSERECAEGIWLAFPYEITALRMDPIDKPGRFSFEGICIKAEKERPAPAEQMRNIKAVYHEMTLAEYMIDYKECRAFQKTDRETTLIFTHEMSRTGAPQLCLSIAKEIKKQGGDVIFISPQSGELYADFQELSSAVFLVQPESSDLRIVLQGLSEEGISKAILNTVVCGAYAKMLAEYHYDVLALIHEMRSSIHICAAEHSAAMIAEYAQKIVFPSRFVKQEFALFAPKIKARVLCIHQGVYRWQIEKAFKENAAKELHGELGLPEDTKIVLCAGALNFGKGADILPLLLQECKRISLNAGEKLVFIWLGENAETAYPTWLRLQVEKMHMQTQIFFPGYKEAAEDYKRYMMGADAFLLPSREDSMPSVLLEAMSCRTPVLAFKNSGGAEELLAQGRGVLVPFWDIEQMARCLLQVLENGEITKQMVEKAALYVQQYGGMKEYVCRLWDFWKE